MKLYCGIDLHSNNNVNVIINETGEVVSRKKLANDLNLVLRFLEPFKAQTTGVVIESTFNWY
jgi:transposase